MHKIGRTTRNERIRTSDLFNESIRTSDMLIQNFTVYLIQYFYNSKTRRDSQNRITDSYSTPKKMHLRKSTFLGMIIW